MFTKRGDLSIRSLYLVHVYEKVGNCFVVVLLLLLYGRMLIGHGGLPWKPTVEKVRLVIKMNALLSETVLDKLFSTSLHIDANWR